MIIGLSKKFDCERQVHLPVPLYTSQLTYGSQKVSLQNSCKNVLKTKGKRPDEETKAEEGDCARKKKCRIEETISAGYVNTYFSQQVLPVEGPGSRYVHYLPTNQIETIQFSLSNQNWSFNSDRVFFPPNSANFSLPIFAKRDFQTFSE